MMLWIKNLFCFFFFFLFLLTNIHSQKNKQKFLFLKDIEIGMKAYGYARFEKNTLKKFEVDIVGISKSFTNRNSYFILGRIKGPVVSEIGAFRGMSGSPVYVDDKLIGSLSAVEQFIPKNPKPHFVYIQPIEYMLDIFELDKMDLGYSYSNSNVSHVSDDSFFFNDLFKKKFLEFSNSFRISENYISLFFQNDPQFHKFQSFIKNSSLSRLFYKDKDLKKFQGLNLINTAFNSGHNSGDSFNMFQKIEKEYENQEVKASDSISVCIASGDFEFNVTGTVTYKDGKKVLMFGHPFINSLLGEMSYPLKKSYVFDIIWTPFVSSVINHTYGPFIGKTLFNHHFGILGLLDSQVQFKKMDFTIHLENFEKDIKRTFQYSINNSNFFNDLHKTAYSLILFYSLFALNMDLSNDFSLDFKTKITVLNLNTQKKDSIKLRNIYSKDNLEDIILLMNYLFNILENNPFAKVEILSVETSFKMIRKSNILNLHEAFIHQKDIFPGDVIPLSLTFLDFKKNKVQKEVQIEIPKFYSKNQLNISVGNISEISLENSLNDFIYEKNYTYFHHNISSYNNLIQSINRWSEKNYVLSIYYILNEKEKILFEGKDLSYLPASIENIFKIYSPHLPLKPVFIKKYFISNYLIRGIKKLSINIKK